LVTRPQLRRVTKTENRACAAAWNQGLQASATNWILFLNNDVLTPVGWLEKLVTFAEKSGASVVSPALGEGELDYDLASYAREFMTTMREVSRPHIEGGVAFLVHRRVFERVGGFDENFRKGGNEDVDFFWRAQAAGFTLATTGASYLHHFGSVTQTALKAERGSTRAETIGYFRAKWKIGWAKRRWQRLQRKVRAAWWSWNERRQHGLTLLTTRAGGKIIHR
jgi:GT2 family glycosyltransferase